MAGYIATAKRQDWNTPKVIVDAVHACFRGPPDLDPCSNETSIVGATNAWHGGGLDHAWSGRVYVNPPFGKGLRAWVERCRSAEEAIALLPAAVDTKVWQEVVLPTAARVCFLKGRLKFIGAAAHAPFPAACVYWGPNPTAFEAAFYGMGWMVTP